MLKFVSFISDKNNWGMYDNWLERTKYRAVFGSAFIGRICVCVRVCACVCVCVFSVNLSVLWYPVGRGGPSPWAPCKLQGLICVYK